MLDRRDEIFKIIYYQIRNFMMNKKLLILLLLAFNTNIYSYDTAVPFTSGYFTMKKPGKAKFQISQDNNNRKGITVSHTLTDEDLLHKVLLQVPVDDAVNYIHEEKTIDGKSFESNVGELADMYQNDIKAPSIIGSKCKQCEFVCSVEDEKSGLRSGFKQCWSESLGWTEADFEESTVLNISNYRNTDNMIAEGKIKFSELSKEDLKIKEDKLPGLSSSQRQWLQVEMEVNKNSGVYIDYDGLKSEIETWVFPLHFIDFETSTVALPFTKGRKPYEGIAFQFSHHIYHENGDIEHKSQYVDTEQGKFPNFDFVRALKEVLEHDQGTIFRYADHENSYLNLIYQQIQELHNDIADAEELCEFIKTITHSTSSSLEKWAGERDMVDMLKVVKRYHYDPATKGSNSIKEVLPAVLNSSQFLKDKYSQPIYGAKDGIQSLNFTDWVWVETKDNTVIDPYKKLPTLFDDISEEDIELLSNDNEIADGGAALTAYAKLQFEDISDYERNELEKGLLKYCELDTFAMVDVPKSYLKDSVLNNFENTEEIQAINYEYRHNITNNIEQDLPEKARPIGMAIFDFLSNSKPEDTSSLSFGAIRNLVKKRINSTPDDKLLLLTTQYLTGDRTHLLELNFNFFDEDTGEWYPLTTKAIKDAESNGQFKHPETDDIIEDYESHIILSYSSSKLANQLKE
ncbi:hypothetical protein GQR58_021163 [Nymphon striatum]|nr:hypothetical protein GQR58_021163 [Nymphon striatum]